MYQKDENIDDSISSDSEYSETNSEEEKNVNKKKAKKKNIKKNHMPKISKKHIEALPVGKKECIKCLELMDKKMLCAQSVNMCFPNRRINYSTP